MFTIYFDPTKTEAFKDLPLKMFGRWQKTVGGMRLEVSVCGRDDNGEWIYCVDVPGALPYFLPEWMPQRAVNRIEDTVSTHNQAELERFSRQRNKRGSVWLRSYRCYPMRVPRASMSLGGRSLDAMHGLMRELHGGDIGFGEGTFNERTRIWINGKGGKIGSILFAQRSEELKEFLAIWQEDYNKFSASGEERPPRRFPVTATVGEGEKVEVVHLLFPQGSPFQPTVRGCHSYIDLPVQLAEYPAYCESSDVWAVSRQVLLKTPISQSALDDLEDEALRVHGWVLGFAGGKEGIAGLLIGAANLEEVVRLHDAVQ